MNVFELRNRLITDYGHFVRGFIHIQDRRLRDQIEEERAAGLLWPEPLLQLNPSFEPGAWIDELVDSGILHAECRKLFRKDKSAAEQRAAVAHAAIRYLRHDETLPERARKLLSFTDNRQDASLPARHFNDFIEIGLLRSALYRAVAAAGPAGLRYDELVPRVFDTLDLPLHLYASDPNVRFQALEETRRALRSVLGYRLYRDLKRGWRITAPNLEQCGLLEITYLSLDDVCQAEDVWSACHPALATATPQTRREIAKTLISLTIRCWTASTSATSCCDLPEPRSKIPRQHCHAPSPWCGCCASVNPAWSATGWHFLNSVA